MARAFKKPKRPRGTVVHKIDWSEVDEMLADQCLGTEIAAALGICGATLYDRCEAENGVIWSEYMRQKKARGCQILRRVQMNIAKEGNPSMAIFLGKNLLKQKDKPDDDIEDMEKDLAYLQKKIESYKKINEPKKPDMRLKANKTPPVNIE